MVVEVSVKDEKSELFLALLDELKTSMVENFTISDKFEKELEKRVDEIKKEKVKTLTKDEVFDGLC